MADVIQSKTLIQNLLKKIGSEVGIIAILVALLIFVVPQFLYSIGQGFRVGLLGRFMALGIAALGIDLIWGYTGLLSLGHGIFFALGGYGIAMFLLLQIPDGQLPDFFNLNSVTTLPWFWQPFGSLPFTIAAVILIPALVAAVVGYFVFRNRIRGVYFSILTQAALIVFYNIFNTQQKWINGSNGLKTDSAKILGQLVSSPTVQWSFYLLSLGGLVAAYALCRWLTTGRFGRLLVAIRDDEPRVRFTGYDPTGFKVLVLAISAALAGIAGALFTVQSGIITPKAMEISSSIEMVIWVAVGGRATLVGAVVGAILVNFAKSILSEQFPAVWLFFQGALFLLVVTALPNGIVGWLRVEGYDLWQRLLGKRRARTYPQLDLDENLQGESQIDSMSANDEQ
jgi:urea transport system permease protein